MDMVMESISKICLRDGWHIILSYKVYSYILLKTIHQEPITNHITMTTSTGDVCIVCLHFGLV